MKLLSVVKRAGEKAAQNTVDTASIFYMYQISEPTDVSQRMDAMKNKKHVEKGED